MSSTTIKNESSIDSNSTSSVGRSTRSKKTKKGAQAVPMPTIIKEEKQNNSTFTTDAKTNAHNITPESVYEDALEADNIVKVVANVSEVICLLLLFYVSPRRYKY